MHTLYVVLIVYVERRRIFDLLRDWNRVTRDCLCTSVIATDEALVISKCPYQIREHDPQRARQFKRVIVSI